MTKTFAGINTVLAVAPSKLLRASLKSRAGKKIRFRDTAITNIFVVIYNRQFSGFISVLRAVCKPASPRIGNMSPMDRLSHS